MDCSPGRPTVCRGIYLSKRKRGQMDVRIQTLQSQGQRPLIQSVRGSIRQFFHQFRVIRRAIRHPLVPWHVKMVASCAVLYIFSPIQLIPNFIPIVGQMDDVLVVGLGMKFLRKFVSKDILEECEKDAR